MKLGAAVDDKMRRKLLGIVGRLIKLHLVFT